MAVEEEYVKEEFLNWLEDLKDYLQDLCRRTMFQKVRQGFWGIHKMPCWQKTTRNKE